jgi:poly-gamma-glutamate synthesis protein (capsule biosynthesis protein)
VVQPPECVAGRPVFFSLGNHVFDQQYPETKRGLIADCTIRNGSMGCSAIATETAPGSAMPQVSATSEAARALGACPATLTLPATVSGFSLR